MRILVVEDEWLLASEASRRLKQSGFEVLGPLPTIEQALAAIDGTRPDAAVLDVQLDGETTFGLAAELKRRRIPILFLTGHAIDDHPANLKDATVLPKPADWNAVIRVLKEMLDKT